MTVFILRTNGLLSCEDWFALFAQMECVFAKNTTDFSAFLSIIGRVFTKNTSSEKIKKNYYSIIIADNQLFINILKYAIISDEGIFFSKYPHFSECIVKIIPNDTYLNYPCNASQNSCYKNKSALSAPSARPLSLADGADYADIFLCNSILFYLNFR